MNIWCLTTFYTDSGRFVILPCITGENAFSNRRKVLFFGHCGRINPTKSINIHAVAVLRLPSTAAVDEVILHAENS